MWTLLVVTAAAAPDAVLPEGTVLLGVDGTLVPADGSDVWFFEISDDVNDADVRLPAGTRLELLPCRTLAQVMADAHERLLPQYRIAAQVTCYQGKNFLLPSYYLPLSKLKDANEPGQRPAQETPEATRTDHANGALAIPNEALELLRSRRPVRGPQRATPAPGAAAPQNRATRVLVDLTGIIESQEGRWRFIPDGLGWNVSMIHYELLPSRVLEQTQRTIAASPNPIRFNVAGLVTEFKGVTYLVLQRTIRVYDYGNFSE